MSRAGYFPVVLIVAILAGASAQTGSGNSLFVRTALLKESSEGAADIPDEPGTVIATGDFNRDGIADLVEATPSGGSKLGQRFLTVRLGQTDGTFASLPTDNRIGSDPRALVVGDFNGDGIPDVIVGDGDGTLLEFLGDGTGKLHRAGSLPRMGSVASIATGHFTHDGYLDLVISDVESNSAVILLGSRSGAFRQAWSFQLPRRGMEFHIATADFDKDGISDLVVTSEDSEDYEVMLGNGNGTFTYAPKLSHLRDPNSKCPT
ncbi:MAG: VCBS repeat-containing protein [Terracidiphilus sp.]